MPADVLVVDDHLPTAEKVARLIEKETGLVATSSDDPDASIDIFLKNNIKVIVLDQRMPAMPGTTLMGKLRELDSSVKAVMLTAKASADEIGAAIPMKFDHFVKKGNVSALPEIVFDLYLKYIEDSASHLRQNRGRLVSTSRRYWIIGARVNYRVEAVKILDPVYVVNSEWKTNLKIDAGEEQEYTEQEIRSSKFTIEEQSQETLTINLAGALPVKAFSFKLEEVMGSILKTNLETSIQVTSGVKRVYKLPPEPADTSQIHITSRHFQRAPVYIRTLVRLSRSCSNCKNSTLLPVVTLYPTDRVASRHSDYYSDNSIKITDTGIL